MTVAPLPIIKYFDVIEVNHTGFRGGDLSPETRTMNSMRFPANLAPRRSQHEEDAIHRRADHWRHQAARSRRQGRGYLPQTQHFYRDLLQLAQQIRRA